MSLNRALIKNVFVKNVLSKNVLPNSVVVVIVSNPVNVYTNQLMYTFPRECIHSLKSQGAF